MKNANSILVHFLVLSINQLLTAQVFSQLKNAQFEMLSEKNGLSSNYASSVLEDRDGFYWIATRDGLNRFDGSTCTIFRYNKHDSNSISHNLCNTLLQGDDGDIWIATMKGVNRYNRKTGKFRKYILHHKEINDDILNRIYELAKDKQGNIWATGYGLWKIEPSTNKVAGYCFDANNKAGPSDGGQNMGLFYDSVLNGFWFQTPFYFNFFDISSGKFYHKTHNPHHWPIFELPLQDGFLTSDGNGNVWVYDDVSKLYHFNDARRPASVVEIRFPRTVDGMVSVPGNRLLFSVQLMPSLLYHWKNGKIDTMPAPFSDKQDVNSRQVNNIYKDRHENTWFCTRSGIAIQKKPNNAERFYFLPKDEYGFDHAIWSMAKTHDNIFWLGTKNSLYIYDSKKQEISMAPAPFGQYTTRSLLNAGDTLIWIGNTVPEIRLMELGTNRVKKIIPLASTAFFFLEDWQHHIWAGTWSNGLMEFDSRGNLLNHYTVSDGLCYNGLLGGWYETDSAIWVGMNGGDGFARFDLHSRQFRNFLIDAGPESSIASNTINALLEDNQGKIWLGTYGGGVYYFDPQTMQFTNYSNSDGLSGDFINTLTLDNNGNLWISTTNGVDVLDTHNRQISNVIMPMKFDDNGYINNLLAAKDNWLYYSSNGRITGVHTSSIVRDNQEPRILVNNVKLFDKVVAAYAGSSLIRLNHEQNFFSVEYSVLKISPDIPARYRYKLDGFDPDWNNAGNRGLANYTNVPPGTYTLLLDATGESGTWSAQPLAISIIIDPPFWKTWWFYLLSMLLIAGAIILVTQNRIVHYKKHQREQLKLIVATQEKEKKSISAGLHDDLGVRLSALKYFVASLKHFLQPNNPAAAETYQRTMATIDESVEDIRYLLINLSPKTLNDYGYLAAVEDLVNKLGKLHVIHVNLQQKGMEQRLQSEVEAGLYRITQELINNTLKHAGASTINLDISRHNGSIHLQYSDNGKGFNPAQHNKGYGMENIHTRVSLLNGKIEWHVLENKSTKVTINIPYNHT